MSYRFKGFFDKYANYLPLLIILAYFAVNHDILLDLYRKWYAQELTGAYSHGMFVAMIVLYLVYKKVKNIREYLVPEPSNIGLAILICVQCLMFIAKIGSINFIQHFLLVLSVLAIVWSIFSFQIARQFILPAIVFSLTFPVWSDARPILQNVTIHITNFILGFTGLPYYREGTLFHFPNGIIEIAPECAGLQQLLVSLIIGMLFSMQHRLRLPDTVKTLIFISAASLLINAVRIIIIMYIGYYTKMESSLITKHLLLGWVIYGIGIYLFLFFYSRLKFKTATELSTEKSVHNQSPIIYWDKQLSGLYVWITLLVLLPTILIAMITKIINTRVVPPVTLTQSSGEWQKISSNIESNWKPNFPVSDKSTTAMYTNGHSVVYVNIKKYSRMLEGVEPINMINTPYNPEVWVPMRHENIEVSNANGTHRNLQLVYLSSKNNNQYFNVLTYYIIDGKIVSDLVGAKLAVLFGLLKLKYDIQIVNLAITPELGGDGGKSTLVKFFHDFEIH